MLPEPAFLWNGIVPRAPNRELRGLIHFRRSHHHASPSSSSPSSPARFFRLTFTVNLSGSGRTLRETTRLRLASSPSLGRLSWSTAQVMVIFAQDGGLCKVLRRSERSMLSMDHRLPSRGMDTTSPTIDWHNSHALLGSFESWMTCVHKGIQAMWLLFSMPGRRWASSSSTAWGPTHPSAWSHWCPAMAFTVGVLTEEKILLSKWTTVEGLVSSSQKTESTFPISSRASRRAASSSPRWA
mmetsp:Transcript_70814/g.162358  ORF Transcript_70814/g.162358 Transcript_70814/m.162358 type:complete len:240 (-) Transcript_70814:426-1145(-)